MIRTKDCVKYQNHYYRVLDIRDSGAYTVAYLHRSGRYKETLRIVPLIQLKKVPRWMRWIELIR